MKKKIITALLVSLLSLATIRYFALTANAAPIAAIGNQDLPSSITLTFRDLKSNDIIEGQGLHDFTTLTKNRTYEVKIVYDFHDKLDMSKYRIYIFLPSEKIKWGHPQDMLFIIEDLNGNIMAQYKTQLAANGGSDYYLSNISRPKFTNLQHPYGTEISSEIFTDGIIFNDIKSPETGYISFTVGTNENSASEAPPSDQDAEDNRWMPILSISILVVALIIVYVTNKRRNRQQTNS